MLPAMSYLAERLRTLGHQPWYPRIGAALVPLDRAVGLLTKGRYVAFGMKEIPSLLLTTTGRRTGQARTNPLLYAADADSFVVVGTNWGRPQPPAWSLNLLANPTAVVTIGGHRIRVDSGVAMGDERDRLWSLLVGVWPAYETYRRRAHNRDIVVFVLRPQGTLSRAE
jgi:deazaflavin-dependent oxidoreductase (nitroreductase family)